MTSSVHSTYRHEALLYRDLSDFLAQVVPFVMEGVAREQPVLVAVTGDRLPALSAALGTAADYVSMVDMSELGRNPARIIPAWLNFVEKSGPSGVPVRGVGEPVWAGRTPAEIAECQLHESLLNMAVAVDTPMWLICPYDVAALDDEVIAEARRSHPLLVDRGAYSGSTDYGGAYHVQELFTAALGEPVDATRPVGFDTVDVRVMSPWITAVAVNAGIDQGRAEGLGEVMAALADDSLRCGAGRGTVRHWTQGSTLICEVWDAGTATDPLVGRYVAPRPGSRPGLWQANQTCDLVQVRSNPNGTTVRVHVELA